MIEIYIINEMKIIIEIKVTINKSR